MKARLANKQQQMKKVDMVKGVEVTPHSNNNDHNYVEGQVYTIVSTKPGGDNNEGVFQARDEEGVLGNYGEYRDFYVVGYPKPPKPEVKAHIWETLVLPPEYEKLIIATIEQVKDTTYEKIFVEWGFGETIEKGKGSILLFYGTPGTGKTMCAEGIAEKLGKDYIMLSSADFQSPIPGETERNMKEAFKKATAKDLIVILDECDSILVNRDRVGAILAGEINCLLSEIERFEGVCIMTSNRSVELDPALARRIALKLEFPMPDPSVREAIFKKLIPKKAPLAGDVDLKLLSKYEISGGQIKNALLLAARLACAAEAKEISMAHFAEGIKRELLGDEAWKRSKKYTPAALDKDLQLRPGVGKDIHKVPIFEKNRPM